MLEWRVERDFFMMYTYPNRSLEGFSSHVYVEIKQQSILQIRINKKCRKKNIKREQKKSSNFDINIDYYITISIFIH